MSSTEPVVRWWEGREYARGWIEDKMASRNEDGKQCLKRYFCALYCKLENESYHVQCSAFSQETSPGCLRTDAGGEARSGRLVLRIHGPQNHLQNVPWMGGRITSLNIDVELVPTQYGCRSILAFAKRIPRLGLSNLRKFFGARIAVSFHHFIQWIKELFSCSGPKSWSPMSWRSVRASHRACIISHIRTCFWTRN